jgi:hypothetical protein
MFKMINWLRDPVFGPELIQDKPHLTDTFHQTVGRGLFKECDATTLAMYQAHSEIHVVYFMLGQVWADYYEYKSNPPRYILRYCPIEGWINELRMPIKYLDQCYRIVIGGGYFAGAYKRHPKHKSYQEFTVELLGRRNFKIGLRKHSEFPLLLRRGAEKLWLESNDEVIEIWRTRVFLCSLPKLAAGRETSPQKEKFPYLEEQHYPKWKKRIVSCHQLEMLNHRCPPPTFVSIATEINNRDAPFVPANKLYRTSKDFLRDVIRVFKQILKETGIPPTQKEVAARMLLNLVTFKAYWGDTKKQWNDFKKHMIRRTTSVT